MFILSHFVYHIPWILQWCYAVGLLQPLFTQPSPTSSRFLTVFHRTHDPKGSQGSSLKAKSSSPPPTKGAQLVTETSAALFSPTFGRLYHGLFNHLIIVVKNSKNKLSWKMAKHIYLSVVQFGFFRHSRRFFLFYSKTTLNREDESSQYKTKN